MRAGDVQGANAFQKFRGVISHCWLVWFEVGADNHEEQVCGQSRGKLNFFEIILDKCVSVLKARFSKTFFSQQCGDLEQFGFQVLTDHC